MEDSKGASQSQVGLTVDKTSGEARILWRQGGEEKELGLLDGQVITSLLCRANSSRKEKGTSVKTRTRISTDAKVYTQQVLWPHVVTSLLNPLLTGSPATLSSCVHAVTNDAWMAPSVVPYACQGSVALVALTRGPQEAEHIRLIPHLLPGPGPVLLRDGGPMSAAMADLTSPLFGLGTSDATTHGGFGSSGTYAHTFGSASASSTTSFAFAAPPPDQVAPAGPAGPFEFGAAVPTAEAVPTAGLEHVHPDSSLFHHPDGDPVVAAPDTPVFDFATQAEQGLESPAEAPEDQLDAPAFNFGPAVPVETVAPAIEFGSAPAAPAQTHVEEAVTPSDEDQLNHVGMFEGLPRETLLCLVSYVKDAFSHALPALEERIGVNDADRLLFIIAGMAVYILTEVGELALYHAIDCNLMMTLETLLQVIQKDPDLADMLPYKQELSQLIVRRTADKKAAQALLRHFTPTPACSTDASIDLAAVPLPSLVEVEHMTRQEVLRALGGVQVLAAIVEEYGGSQHLDVLRAPLKTHPMTDFQCVSGQLVWGQLHTLQQGGKAELPTPRDDCPFQFRVAARVGRWNVQRIFLDAQQKALHREHRGYVVHHASVDPVALVHRVCNHVVDGDEWISEVLPDDWSGAIMNLSELDPNDDMQRACGHSRFMLLDASAVDRLESILHSGPLVGMLECPVPTVMSACEQHVGVHLPGRTAHGVGGDYGFIVYSERPHPSFTTVRTDEAIGFVYVSGPDFKPLQETTVLVEDKLVGVVQPNGGIE